MSSSSSARARRSSARSTRRARALRHLRARSPHRPAPAPTNRAFLRQTAPFFTEDITFSTIQDGWNNTYGCVRTIRAASADGAAAAEDSQYCEWRSGEVEFYDVAADPWNSRNLAPALAPAARARYHARLQELRACAGASC